MVVRVLAQVPGGVRAPDRIGLTEQVVGQSDVAIGIRAGELGERAASPLADLVLVDPEQLREVGVALAPLEEQLERRLLVGSERHRERKPTD